MTNDDDDENTLRYDRMVESALRGVVREALEEVIETGEGGELPGEHHFYITFRTDFPGVKIPPYLRDRYPGEMTIVLQWQFYDLMVDDEKMGITLSFNNKLEPLEIPLAAITIFADPSVNFALQFQPMNDEADDFPDGGDDDTPGGGGGDGDKGEKKTGEVVSLDKFRKK
jgi:hypothetical protein